MNYGMREIMLGKVYVTVMGVAPDSANANALFNWRLPAHAGKVRILSFSFLLFLSDFISLLCLFLRMPVTLGV